MPSSSSASPPWNNLPTDVGILILERLPVSDYIRFASICQNWRLIQKNHRRLHLPNPPPMRKSFPWIVYSPLSVHCYSRSKSMTIPLSFTNTPYQFRPFSCSKGWIFLICQMKRISLLNPLTNFHIQLPRIEINPQCITGALSSSPLDPNCIALILEKSTNLAHLCWVGKRKRIWTSLLVLKVSADEKYFGVGMKVFYSKMKFYCFYRGSWAIIDPAHSKPSAQILEMDGREITSFSSQRLVELRGEFMLIEEIHGHKEFQVFRADFHKLKWTRLIDVADLVFFITVCGSVCLSASDVGLKGNCVYTNSGCPGNDTWRVFDMDSNQWSDGPCVPACGWVLNPELC